MIKAFTHQGNWCSSSKFHQFVEQLSLYEEYCQRASKDDWIIVVGGLCFSTTYKGKWCSAEVDALIIRPQGFTLLDSLQVQEASSLIAQAKIPWQLSNDDKAIGLDKNPYQQAKETRALFECYLQQQAESSPQSASIVANASKPLIHSAVWVYPEIEIENILPVSSNSWFTLTGSAEYASELDYFARQPHTLTYDWAMALLKELGVSQSAPELAKEKQQAVSPVTFRLDQPVRQPVEGTLGLVHFPIVSLNKAVLCNVQVIALEKPAEQKIQSCSSSPSCRSDELGKTLYPSRSYEDNVEAAVRVIVSSVEFIGRSHQLALAIADQIARHGAIESGAVCATGAMLEHGYVGAVGELNQKISAVTHYATRANITTLVISNENYKDIDKAQLNALDKAKVRLLAISELSELEGVLWQKRAELDVEKSVSKDDVRNGVKPMSLRSFLNIGLLVVPIAIGVFVLNGGRTSPTSPSLLETQNERVERLQLLYENEPDNWQHLFEFVKVLEYTPPEHWSKWTPQQQRQARTAQLRVHESETRIDKLSAFNLKAELELRQGLAEAYNQLTDLDKNKLLAVRPLYYQQLQVSVAQYYAHWFAQQYSDELYIDEVERLYRLLLSLSVETQNELQRNYASVYFSVMAYPQRSQNSQRRLAKLQNAAEEYSIQLREEKPNPSAWNKLIKANQALTNDDRSREPAILLARRLASQAKAQIDASQTRIEALLVVLDRARIDESSTYQQVTTRADKLSDFDKQRLDEKSTQLISQYRETHRFNLLATQIQTSSSLKELSEADDAFLSLTESEQLSFAQRYPKPYNALSAHQQEMDKSDGRIAQLHQAALLFKPQRYSEQPTLALWHQLIAARNTLTPRDIERLTESDLLASQQAELAAQDIVRSDLRVKRFLKAAESFGKIMQPGSVVSDDVRNKVQHALQSATLAILPIDKARLDSTQRKFYQKACDIADIKKCR